MGGWNLPPGCGPLPGEEPDPCEDCWNVDENDICPVGDISKMTNEDFDKCPVHCMVDKCENCGKRMRALLGYLPKEYIVGNPWDGPVGCCSKNCAEELKAKYDAEIEKMRKEEEAAAQAYEEAVENYEGSPEEWSQMLNMGIITEKEYKQKMKAFNKQDRKYRRRMKIKNFKKKFTKQPCQRCRRELKKPTLKIYHGWGGCPFEILDKEGKHGKDNL